MISRRPESGLHRPMRLMGYGADEFNSCRIMLAGEVNPSAFAAAMAARGLLIRQWTLDDIGADLAW